MAVKEMLGSSLDWPNLHEHSGRDGSFGNMSVECAKPRPGRSISKCQQKPVNQEMPAEPRHTQADGNPI